MTPDGNVIGVTDGAGGITTADPLAGATYPRVDAAGRIDLSGRLAIPTSPADAARAADVVLRGDRPGPERVHQRKHTLSRIWQQTNRAPDGGLNRAAISRLLRDIGVSEYFKVSHDGKNVIPHGGGIEVAYNSTPADGSIELTFRWRE